MLPFSITGTLVFSRALDDVVLHPPDVVEARRGTSRPAARPRRRRRGSRSGCACSSSSSIASTHCTTSAPLDRARQHPGHEVDALEHHRPALLERPLDRGLDADEHVPRLVEEAASSGSRLRVRVGERAAGLEARVVDRGMNSSREERAHRLADEVGRGDARDPEAVRDLGRDRRLARAGRAADEHDDRQVELVQLAVAAQPADGVAPSSLAEQSRASSSSRSSRRSPRGRAARGPPRSAARARTRGRRETPVADQRARHQALRVRAGRPRRRAAAGRRWRGSLTGPPPRARSPVGEPRAARRRGRAAERDDVVVGEHDLAPRARAPPRRRRRPPPP